MCRRIVIGLVLVLLPGCNAGEAAPSDPWGFTTVDLPDTVEAIGTVFEAMPVEVAGYSRVDDAGGGEHLVDYGDGGPSAFVQFGEHRVVDGVNLSTAEFLSWMAGSGELDIIGSVLEDDVVWLHGSTAVGDETGEWTEYLLVWGEAEGESLFWFTAESQEDLDALAEGFVEAATG